jgi:hypothetical protein
MKSNKKKTMKRKISGGGAAFSNLPNKSKTPVKTITPKKSKRVTFKNSPLKISPEDLSPEEFYLDKFKKRSTTDVLTALAKEEGISGKTHIKEFVDQGISKLRNKKRYIKKTNSSVLVSLYNKANSKEAILAQMIADLKKKKKKDKDNA